MPSEPLSEIDVHVGESLSRLRLAASLTIADLALMLDVDARRLARIEAGTERAGAEFLIKAAMHFCVSTAVFYEGFER